MSSRQGRLDFQGYDETEFEEFCFELLRELGFVNMNWRKGTALSSSPADRGRDIEAWLVKTDIDGSKHLERWFVDCKHYQSGVPPEKLHGLLTWAWVERPHVVLVIASGFLSNGAKDFLDAYETKNRPPFRIKFWERTHLGDLTSEKREFLDRWLRPDELVHRADREVAELNNLSATSQEVHRVWTNVPTGLRDVDRMTNGFGRATLNLITGWNGSGKSVLIRQIALAAAVMHRRPVAFFSSEMTKERLVERLLSQHARIDSVRLHRSTLSDREYERLAGAIGPLGDAPIGISESIDMSEASLRRAAQEAKERAGVDVILLDSLPRRLADWGRPLKSLAQELDVPVIVTSSNPGSLIEEADLVLQIHSAVQNASRMGIAELTVAKNRHGPTGVVEVAFRRELGRFDNLDRGSPYEA